MKSNAIVLVLTVLALGLAYGDTHPAASCSQTAVQSAITAAHVGDTVAVPAGNGAWSGLSLPEDRSDVRKTLIME